MSHPSSDAPSSSASTIVASATSGYHVLKIEGYSFTKSVPNGERIQSRTFRMAGHNWFIQYFPNGVCKEATGYVSFYLVLVDRTTEALMVHHSFSFIDQLYYQSPSYVHGLQPSNFRIQPGHVHASFGCIKFIKREDLERSVRLKDDCFMIRCDIVVVGKIPAVDASMVPSSAPPAVVVPPPDWPQHFRALLKIGQGADVRFLVDGRTFDAHWCVLAARSPVFSAELYGGMEESDTTHPVQVDEMRADVFKNLLHFIYTDSLPPEMTAEGQQEASSMAQHLLVAADRYDMERLKVICEDKLCRLVDVSSAGTMLLLAEQHLCRRLKEACLEFLTTLKALNVATATDGFQNLAKNFPLYLVRSNCQT